MNKHRYKIFKEHNLIIAQIINADEPILTSIKTMCRLIAADKDYHHDMDFITDMKKPNYPTDEFFYNDLARTLSVEVKFNRFIRIICPNDDTLKRNYRVFITFAADSRDVSKENYFVSNIPQALAKLGKENDAELKTAVEDFFIFYQ